jgi:hypothetical protein
VGPTCQRTEGKGKREGRRLGWRAAVGRKLVCQKGKERSAAWFASRAKEKKRKKREAERKRKAGWAKERKGRGVKGVWVFSFFFKLLFKLLKFKLFSNFANFTQIIKPCIQIMMHKHLLILKLLK